MAAQKGRNFLLKISSGTSPATFTTVAGLRANKLTVNNDMVDITTMDDAPFRQLLADAGLRKLAVSASGVFEDDTALHSVETLALNGGIQYFRLYFDSNHIYEGSFQVTSLEFSGAYNNEMTYAITLESAGLFQKLQ